MGGPVGHWLGVLCRDLAALCGYWPAIPKTHILDPQLHRSHDRCRACRKQTFDSLTLFCWPLLLSPTFITQGLPMFLDSALIPAAIYPLLGRSERRIHSRNHVSRGWQLWEPVPGWPRHLFLQASQGVQPSDTQQRPSNYVWNHDVAR